MVHNLEEIQMVVESYCGWEVLHDKCIIISGGTGFIGSFIIDVFRFLNDRMDLNIKVVSFSRNPNDSDETVTYIRADIKDSIYYGENVDYILHLASNTHPNQYGNDPVGTISTNIFGCYNLLCLAREKKARFLMASSVEIYGQAENVYMNETYCGYINCNEARSGYNEAKRTCESLCQSFRKQYDVDVVIARLARVFGADRKKDSKAMAQFIDKAVLDEDIVLNSYGNQRYSYCYVADAASGLLRVMLEGNTGEAYNISGRDEGLTLGEYAEYIAGLANRKVCFKFENNDAASKATYALMDITKIEQLGWKPIFEIRDALKRSYETKKNCNEVHGIE